MSHFTGREVVRVAVVQVVVISNTSIRVVIEGLLVTTLLFPLVEMAQ